MDFPSTSTYTKKERRKCSLGKDYRGWTTREDEWEKDAVTLDFEGINTVIHRWQQRTWVWTMGLKSSVILNPTARVGDGESISSLRRPPSNKKTSIPILGVPHKIQISLCVTQKYYTSIMHLGTICSTHKEIVVVRRNEWQVGNL